MEKVIRISNNQGGIIAQHQQGGTYTVINRLVDFEVGAGVYDLSKSYISIPMRGETDTTFAALTCCVESPQQPLDFVSLGNHAYRAESLIRNYHVEADRVGKIHDLRDSHILWQLVNSTKETIKQYEQLNSPFSSLNESGMLNCPFRILRRDGTGSGRPSQGGNSFVYEAQVPLSHIMGIGEVEAFSTVKYGNLRMHFELNVDDLLLRQTLGKATVADDTQAPYNGAMFWGQNNKGGTAGDFVDPVLLNGTPLIILTTTQTYASIEESPFNVGMVLRITRQAGDNASMMDGNAVSALGPNGDRTAVGRQQISSILRNAAGTLQLTFALPIVVPDADGLAATNLIVIPDADTPRLQIDAPELVLYVSPQDKVPDELEVSDWHVEQDSSVGLPANAPGSVQKVYQTSPSAVGMLVLSPHSGYTLSNFGGLKNYRIRVDNKDITDRQIEMQSALHYELLDRAFASMAMKVTNFSESSQWNYELTGQTGTVKSECVALPLPNNGQSKLVELDLELRTEGSRLERLNVYTQSIKVF